MVQVSIPQPRRIGTCQRCEGSGYVPYRSIALDGTPEDPQPQELCECWRSGMRRLADRETAQIVAGYALFAEHGDEIIASYENGIYWVPSRSRATLKHAVEPRKEMCSCEYRQIQDELCAHVFAGTMAASKSACCISCGQRVLNRHLLWIEENGPVFMEGQPICRTCAKVRGCA